MPSSSHLLSKASSTIHTRSPSKLEINYTYDFKNPNFCPDVDGDQDNLLLVKITHVLSLELGIPHYFLQ